MKIFNPQWVSKLGLDKTGMSQHGAPVSFAAGVTNILPGSGAQLDTSALQNGYRTSYWIDEIRMHVYSNTSVTLVSNDASQAALAGGYMMQFQFRTGSYAFSQTPVPMALYAPQFAQQPVLYAVRGDLTTVVGHSVRWPLPKPLFMAPGDVIQCAISRLALVGQFSNTGFNADVTYVGRAIAPGASGPTARCVPYVSSYVHPFSSSYSETTTEFRNPFLSPLWVQRFVGRPGSNSSDGSINRGFTGGDFDIQRSMLPTSTVDGNFKYAAIYVDDSLGYKITGPGNNGYLPVGSVFDTERCAWTFGRPLGPREQFNMKFQTLGANSGTNLVFGVGMVGYREEAA